MIDTAFIFLESLIVRFGSLGIFLASIIEEVIAPIPSAGVMLLAGSALLSEGFHPFFDLLLRVAVPIALGIAVGSLAVFFLSRKFGDAFIRRFGPFLGISMSDLEKMRGMLSRGIGDEIALVVLRFVPFVPSVVIAAFFGLVRMPTLRYLILSFLGSLVRACFLVYVGFMAGELYNTYAGAIARVENTVFAIMIITASVFLVWRILKYRGRSVL